MRRRVTTGKIRERYSDTTALVSDNYNLTLSCSVSYAD
jgi:hypothetical protein